MDFKELLQQVLYLVATGILPILTLYIVTLIKVKVKEGSAKLENDQLKKYIDAALDAIGNSVLMVNQTYTDSLKKSGTFTKESQEVAKNMAIETAKELITEESKKAIEILYGDFNIYLETQIEAMVREYKLDVN